MKRILNECQRPALAEAAVYSYSRGNSEVRGASIRLAEVVARNWGNFDSGVVELEQRNGESTIKTYAWDLESNYRDEKIFTVKHLRDTKKGTYALTDELPMTQREEKGLALWQLFQDMFSTRHWKPASKLLKRQFLKAHR